MYVKLSSSLEIAVELHLELIILAVDRMQWGAEDWQFADLYMPDEPSPYQKNEGVPCVMLIHGGFWKSEYTLALMMASVAERKPWLTIAQAPIADLVAADHAKLSDEGDAVRRWMGCVPEDNEDIWRRVNPVDNPPKTAVLLIHGKGDTEVPWTQSESYARAMAAKGENIQKLWLPGDHFSIIDVASDDWLTQVEAIRDWL